MHCDDPRRSSVCAERDRAADLSVDRSSAPPSDRVDAFDGLQEGTNPMRHRSLIAISASAAPGRGHDPRHRGHVVAQPQRTASDPAASDATPARSPLSGEDGRGVHAAQRRHASSGEPTLPGRRAPRPATSRWSATAPVFGGQVTVIEERRRQGGVGRRRLLPGPRSRATRSRSARPRPASIVERQVGTRGKFRNELRIEPEHRRAVLRGARASATTRARCAGSTPAPATIAQGVRRARRTARAPA